MKLDAVTFGESMAMFYANEYGGLHEVSTFSKGLPEQKAMSPAALPDSDSNGMDEQGRQ